MKPEPTDLPVKMAVTARRGLKHRLRTNLSGLYKIWFVLRHGHRMALSDLVLLPTLQGGRARQPLNGQRGLTRICDSVFDRLDFSLVIETGTFLGNTTRYFAAKASAVHTCEVNPIYFGVASDRLKDLSNVHVHLGSSDVFLESFKKPIQGNAFLYLDAHWYDRLPLRAEISSVCDWDNLLVLVDDFRHPLDSGYKYDSYGPNEDIALDLIADLIEDFTLFFPSIPSAEETGSRSGYAFLTRSQSIADAMGAIDGLQRYDGPRPQPKMPTP